MSQLEVENVHKKLRSEDKDARNSALRRKRCLSQSKVESVRKKIRGEDNDTGWRSSQCLEGLIWSNNSCAYDALLSILYNTWNQDVAFWTAGFERFNGEWLKPLSDLFSQHQGGEISLEEARDKLRRSLARRYPARLRFGEFTYMSDLLDCLFTMEDTVRTNVLECPEGHNIVNTGLNNNSAVLTGSQSDQYISISEWLREQWDARDDQAEKM